jgi:uncharacterized protein (TIGR03086 family)
MTNRHGSAVVTLPSDTEILITRRFDAPKSLVWEAMTRPEHVLRWWGPEWCPLESAEIDLRVGGTWRYVASMEDGSQLAWRGVYREIDPPNSITSTELFEGFPDAESVNTMTLTESDGVTTLQTLVRHKSQEFRDGHIDSGMEGGMQETFNRLDALLVVFDSERERFRRIAGNFTDVVEAVPDDAWSNPAPCEGWVALDVVRHLVEWVPSFFSRAGVSLPVSTSVDDDPVKAWSELREALQAKLDDPVVAASAVDIDPVGRHTVAAAIEMFVTADIVVHAWDLAKAAGLDATIDREMAERLVGEMQAMADVLVASGQYKAAVPVADDADIEDKLIAATGRDPSWSPVGAR